MEDFINILKNMDIHQLRAFVLECRDYPMTDMLKYELRIEEADNIMFEKIKSICTDQNEYEELIGYIMNAFVVRAEVYMDMRMMSKARLQRHLLPNQ